MEHGRVLWPPGLAVPLPEHTAGHGGVAGGSISRRQTDGVESLRLWGFLLPSTVSPALKDRSRWEAGSKELGRASHSRAFRACGPAGRVSCKDHPAGCLPDKGHPSGGHTRPHRAKCMLALPPQARWRAATPGLSGCWEGALLPASTLSPAQGGQNTADAAQPVLGGQDGEQPRRNPCPARTSPSFRLSPFHCFCVSRAREMEGPNWLDSWMPVTLHTSSSTPHPPHPQVPAHRVHISPSVL